MSYELDLYASAPANHITHTYDREDNLDQWVIVPDGGAFYTKDLVVIDTFTGKELTPVTQYRALHTVSEAVLESGGKEVCAILLITNPTTIQVKVTRRVIGGRYQTIGGDVKKLVDEYGIDELNSTAWGQVIGKPDQMPPDMHTHYPEDVYGLQSVNYNLIAIKNAILMGDSNGFGMTYQYIDRLLDSLQTYVDDRFKKIDDSMNKIEKGISYGINQVVFFTDNTNPNGILEGTWVRLPEGVVMLGSADEVGTIKKVGEGPDYVAKRYAAWQRTK